MSRSVWITGASGGIGRALALLLARQGAIVAATARRREELDGLADEGRRTGGRIEPFPADVTDRAGMARAVETIETAIGPLDLVVLNAGTHEPVRVEAFDPAVFERLMAVNFIGTVNGLAAVLPRLLARCSGHIAIVASVAGYRGLPEAAAYGPTKAALINLRESLKLDLDRHGIRLSVVNRGFVRTPLTERNRFPMPFLMAPDDAAARIAAGLERGTFEIAFPRRLAWPMKLGRSLPYALYFRIVRAITGR